MAYADQQMSSSKVVSIILVVIIHVLLGYALVTGLAYQAVKTAAASLDMIDIAEETPPEPEELPPPPPDQPIEPPPVVTPPPIVQPPASPRPQIQQQQTPPPVPQPPRIAPPPPPPPAPPPPPPPPSQAVKAAPKNSPGSWATTNDYPSRALREEREGVTRFSLSIGADGRVTNCSVTGSSGHSDLDAAACSNITRRARFNPAKDSAGNGMTGSYSGSIRWQIPK